jgi:hypothetical protein
MQNPFGKPRWPWISVLVLQAIQLLSMVPWLALAGLSVMAFDAPGSTEKWQPWAFVLAVWSYPLWLLAFGAASWLLLAVGRWRIALALCLLVTLPLPLLLAVMLFVN